MSASLVGSEMCIRDRGHTRTRRPVAQCGSNWVGWPTLLGGFQGLERNTPVSYTHLTLPTICSV
eukprot:13180158-Alexandrium_andersonii.AAC.1